ncbi:host specificity protein J [Photorhabdus luminescens]|uniref:Host specificity protein n=1 Tax=Photorhabdus luminescens subsp. mexicana TaxID=2100167 RepID=A0A4R4ITS3_PHOLU|nr:host specificity protein J [Photorhabdus luminescens]TDB44096.1 host specificity protein [Photorhabdus luminescens subsp. mexicana]
MTQLIQGRKGGGGKGHTPVESPDNLLSTSTAKILLAISNGEIASRLDDTKIFLDGTPIGNPDGSRNFEGVTWEFRPGSQHQEYIKGMPSVDNEINIGMELKSDQSWIRSISNTQLSAVRVRFSIPQLLQQRDNGDTTGYRIEYAIDLNTDGAGFKEVINAAFDGKTTSTYERSHRIDLPKATTGWQIRVRRLTPNKNSGRYADKVNIQAIAEVIDVKLRYPNTALLFVTFNAEQFNNRIPKISVLSKGLLIKVPSNYDPMNRTYSGMWDGTFKLAHSSNPAWVFYDLLLSKLYGLGDRLDASQVDKWELYRIAQYCDQLVPDGRGGDGKEPRFICDVYIQAQNEAYTVLRDLASIFRGMTYWSDNKIIAVADMPRDVSRIFTKASVVDGKFNYGSGSQRNRYTHALVSYGDPSNHYNDAIEVVSDNKLVRRYGVNQTEITAIGCTRQSEANRRGRWALLTNANDRTVSFATGLEGKIPLPGDIIGVADELLSGRVIGGRVSESNGRNITLDRKPGAKVGDRLLINLPSGKSEGRTIQAVNENVVTVSTVYSEVPLKNSAWSVDADDLAIQLYRVTSIDDNNDNTFTINGVYHNPEKYDHIDTGARIDEKPISVIPPGVQPPAKNVRISSYTKIVQGLAITTLRVTWDAVENAIAYEAEWRRDNGNWISAPRTSTQGFEVPNIYAGHYQARVRAINASEISSIWANAPETVLKGKEGNPPVPLNFRTTPIIFGITIDWNFGDDTSDTLKTEIQYSKTNDGEGLMLLTDIPYPQRTHTMQGLAAGVAFYFRARLVDKSGNQSPWTEFIRGESSSDASWIIDAAGDQFLTTDAGKALQSQIDDNSEAVLENAAARGADTKRWMKENGNRKAEIVEVREVQVSDQQSLARYQQQVKAEFAGNKSLIDENKTAISKTNESLAEYKTLTESEFEKQKAMIETKATTVFDQKGDGSATYTVKAGVNYNGQYYDAGMVIGAQAKNGKVTTNIGFNAETFGVFNPANKKLESVFFIKNGQVFMRSAFIDKTVIQELIVGIDLKSLNYVPNKSGLRIDMKSGVFEVNGISGGYRMKITNTGIYIFNSAGVPIIELGEFL